MKKSLASLLVLLLFLPLMARAQNWAIDPVHSSLGFSYTAMGSAIEGQFKRYQASIDWNPANSSTAKIRMEVESSSIDAGLSDATTEALGAVFFDSRKYPQIVFTSTILKPLQQNRYQLDGNLSIKGISHAISLPVTLKPTEGGQQLTGSFTLNRLDYAIGTGQWADTGTLANPVQVNFSFRLIPAKAK